MRKKRLGKTRKMKSTLYWNFYAKPNFNKNRFYFFVHK